MSNNVKITTKFNYLDFIMPHSCRGCGRIGNVICDRCKKNILFLHQNFCPICKTPNSDGICKNHPSFPPTFIVGYRHGLLDQLIHEYKYNSVRSLARPLADILNTILPETHTQTIIVPLPTIARHIRERGLNHTLSISKQLIKLRYDWRIEQLLIRNQNTVQVGANRDARITQASLAYNINPKIKISPKNTYILFDDVWTTGASISAAIKKLRENGAKNIIVALLAVSELQ